MVRAWILSLLSSCWFFTFYVVKTWQDHMLLIMGRKFLVYWKLWDKLDTPFLVTNVKLDYIWFRLNYAIHTCPKSTIKVSFYMFMHNNKKLLWWVCLEWFMDLYWGLKLVQIIEYYISNSWQKLVMLSGLWML